jgi:hypothetical protein
MPTDGPPPGRFDDELEPDEQPSEVRKITNGKAKERPTAKDPLAGLRVLPSIVLRGRDAILEKAGECIDYVWHEIAVAGTVNLIAGPPAEGKTTLLFLLLACRMAPSPMPLLGRLVVPSPPGKWIVLIEAEHSDGGTARKLIQSFETLQIDTKGLEKILIIARKSVKIGDQAWSEIAYLVSLGLISDIAVDTLARASSADSNNEEEQAAIFETIAQTIERAPLAVDRPTVWLVAHTRKGDRAAGLGLADVSGSTQRAGQSDTVILVTGTKEASGETTKSTITYPKLREPPDIYPKPATFSIIRDPDGKRRLSTDQVTAAELATKPLEELIWDQLTEPRTKKWLAEKLGRSGAHIQDAVDNLFAAGRLTGATVTYPGTKKGYSGIARKVVQPGAGLPPGLEPSGTLPGLSGTDWYDNGDS